MDIMTWAVRWGIPAIAIAELHMYLGAGPTPVGKGSAESDVMAAARLKQSKRGGRLWRNNVGAYMDERGNYIRYGLANDTKQMNKQIKSSDGIGIQPVLITQDMVGRVIGQFVARECKREGWSYRGTEHERAQLKFLELIIALGGDAKFIARLDDGR